MDEAGWDQCRDPWAMLSFLGNFGGPDPRTSLCIAGDTANASPRKLRLFACACCRRLTPRPEAPPCRQLLEACESFADGVAAREDVVAAYGASKSRKVLKDDGLAFSTVAVRCAAYPKALAAAARVCRYVAGPYTTKAVVAAHQAALLREIFRPFRPVALDPAWLAWNAGTVARLAQDAYENRLMPLGHLDTARLGVLADALEDAGCPDAEVLRHLRGPGPHVRGCWVVDLLLGKE